MWCGDGFSLSLDDDGDLWCYGDIVPTFREYGSKSETARVKFFSKIQDVASGNKFFAFVDEEEQVWMHGKWLGCDLIGSRERLFAISGLFDIQKVFCGPNSVYCISLDNRVYSFGRNESGCLGVGKETLNIDHPMRIQSLFNITEVAAGIGHALFLVFEGNVYTCGKNTNGERGLSSFQSDNIPRIHPTLKNIVKISCGDEHSIVMDNKDHVYSFGRNDNGRLALGHTSFVNEPKLIPLSETISFTYAEARGQYSLFLDSEGNLFMAHAIVLPNGSISGNINPRNITRNVLSVACGLNQIVYRTFDKIYMYYLPSGNLINMSEYSTNFTSRAIYSKFKSARK